VGNRCKQLIIGIIGGIGSGKSTVAREFGKLGCAVIDADEIAHELLEHKPVKERVIALFGEGVLDHSGRIDRGKLAKVVFSDAAKLSEIDGLLHPLVLERVEDLIRKYRRQEQVKAIVLDVPLLVEAGWARRCDRLVFVDCRAEIRAERAKRLGFLDEKEIKIRENFQISLDKKARLADNMVNNNSDLSALVRQIADVFSNIISNR